MNSRDRVTADYGAKESYEYYKRDNKNPVEKKEYNKVLLKINRKLADLVIYENIDFRFPLGIGNFRIKKYKPKLKLDEDGNLLTNNINVDYKKTKELWGKNPEKRRNKVVVFNFNEHTKGYRGRFWWDKRTSKLKNQSCYYLRVTRRNKRELAKAIKNTEIFRRYYE
jgi:hypothetical protein